MRGKINFVVALSSEASPIIRKFDLYKVRSDSSEIYSNKDHSTWLIISGIGRTNSARATEKLKDVSMADPSTAWLNVGIAGHESLPLGTAILAHKITDSLNNKSWYPQMIFTPECLTASISTADKPVVEYPQDDVVDMEASGFYSVAESYSTREMIHCIKIISDNSQSHINNINTVMVDELISRNLSVIKELVEKLQCLSREMEARASDYPFYKECLSRWRFTVTQTHQLKSLLWKWSLLQPRNDVMDVLLSNCQNSRNVIQTLDAHLKNTSVGMNHD